MVQHNVPDLKSLINVKAGPAPKMIFCAIPTQNSDGVVINVEGYVRMMDLPKDLQEQVRAVLRKDQG